jgi:hypothetical protein
MEDIQYLSRAQFSHPPMPVATLNVSGPIATVEDAVACQWHKYAAPQPIDVDPTFMVAPQSEYYGSVVLPSGQVLHRSSAHNTFQVFRDRATGQPFTVSCHEFTFHIVTPDDPQKSWHLELCYPSNEQLHQAMMGMTTSQTDEDDAGFPTHATRHLPSMLPLHERLRLNQYLPDEGVMADGVLMNNSTTLNPKFLLIPDKFAERAEPLTDEYVWGLQNENSPEQQAVEDTLDESIHQRASTGLQMADDFFQGSDSDSMPELVSLMSRGYGQAWKYSLFSNLRL